MRNELELFLNLPEPEISPEQVQQLVAILVKADEHRSALPPPTGKRKPPAGWLTATEIAAIFGGETTDREVRAIANAACPAVVSFPGSPGYKLWQLCTIEEINHCIESIESQAKDMMRRSVMYRQAYHRRFRGAPGGAVPDCCPSAESPKLAIL